GDKKWHRSNLRTNLFDIVTCAQISSLKANAQIRGEQRHHPNLKHCAINTKFEVEAKMSNVVKPS
ncbi:hypothetical protein ACXITY_25375, partial [Vibrio parahaemolyticus]